MAQLINLGAVRKAKANAATRKQSLANTVKFGRTKAQKALDLAHIAKAKRDLDGLERE